MWSSYPRASGAEGEPTPPSKDYLRTARGSDGGHRHESDNPFSPITLLEFLRTPSCIFDGTGTIVALNPTWYELVGVSRSEDEQIQWEDLISPRDLDLASLHLASVLSAKRGISFECRLKTPEDARWYQLTIQPVIAPAGASLNWLCITADIHDLKCREQALEERASTRLDMLNISADCIKLISLDGALIHMNKAGCIALGLSEDSPFGMPWLPLLPQDLRNIGEQALAKARAGSPARFSGRSVLEEHKVLHWDNMLTPVVGPDGEPTAILCVSRNVTTEREALATLQENEERLLIAARVGALGIWDYHIQRDELHCDETWYRIMGRDPNHPVRSITEFQPFIHPDDVEKATEVMRTAATLLASGEDYLHVFRIIQPNGDIRWVRSAACVEEESGSPKRAVGFLVDITDARRGEIALQAANRVLANEKESFARQSLEDPLTGIANRRFLDAQLTQMCQQVAAKAPICIGMVDVDFFKAFNDRYGHVEGDAALRKIASALQSVVRPSDIVARYGGEEFAFVLTEVTDCEAVLDRFAATLAKLAIIHEDSPTGYLTVSCGGVIFQSCAELTPTSMLKASDEVLYKAKAAGRNRHIIRNNPIQQGLQRSSENLM